MSDPNVHIDYEGILRIAVDKAIADFITSCIPDEQHRKIISGMLAVHRKHGVDAVTSLKIIEDLGKFLEEIEPKKKPDPPKGDDYNPTEMWQ